MKGLKNTKITKRRWWDDDDDGIGWEKGEVSGKFNKKRLKVAKESFSNWREELFEITDEIKAKETKEIKENPSIKNTIVVNPKIEESLGGVVVEANRIDCYVDIFSELNEHEISYLNYNFIQNVVEQVFYECIDEGYELKDIQDTLIESIELNVDILNESNNPDTVKTDRLGKVKTAVKNVGRAIARGAGYATGLAVRGVKAAGREFGAGYTRGRHGSSSGSSDSGSSGSSSSGSSEKSKPGILSRIGSRLKRGLLGAISSGAKSVSRGARNLARRIDKGSKDSSDKGTIITPDTKSNPRSRMLRPTRGPQRPPSGAGQRERVSSGSQTSTPKPTSKPTPKPQQSSPDPWDDTFSSHVSSRGSTTRPRTTERTTSVRPQSQPQSQSQQSTTSSQKKDLKKRKVNAVARAFERARKKGIDLSSQDMERVAASIKEAHYSLATKKVEPGEPYELAERKMTAADKKKESELKKKFDDSEMKQNMIDQYGKEKGTQIYFAKIRKMAMEEEFVDEAKISRTERRERNSNKPKKRFKTMHFVDLDANAMKPKKHGVEAEIEVKKGGKTVRSLNPQEFNKDKKGDDEDYDFKQFRSSKVFKKTLKGNKHVRNLHRGGEASGLTARGGMDNNREVVSHVRNSGFSKKHGVNFKGVHFTGDVPGQGTDDKKMKVIKNLIKAKKPKKIIFSDDHAKNLSAPERFNREEGKDKTKNRGSSTPKIKTYLTRPDGRPVRFGSGGGGVRSSGNVNPPSSNRENQRRRQKARRGMGEEVEMTTQQIKPQNPIQRKEKPIKPLNDPLKRQQLSNLRTLQQKQQQLEKQRLDLIKQGKLPMGDH